MFRIFVGSIRRERIFSVSGKSRSFTTKELLDYIFPPVAIFVFISFDFRFVTGLRDDVE